MLLVQDRSACYNYVIMNEQNSAMVSSLPYHRIVVKFGTSLLTGGSDHINPTIMANLVEQVSRLHYRGAQLIVVSSGAVASGRHKLGLKKKIKGIPFKQVLASVGQSRLMYTYEQLFEPYEVTVAQALLTKADLSDRMRYLNARNTLLALLEFGVICIVNENDVVSVDEIKESRFGDNDNLSAMVCNLVDADVLIILSDISGLYNADPHLDPTAQLIREVRQIDEHVRDLAGGSAGKLGTGGMITKIDAAQLATSSGVHVVIANGREPDAIIRVASGEAIGTHFWPTTSKLESRKRWMLCGLATKGRVTIDDGAALALKNDNRSLLAAGIVETVDEFERGDIVDIYNTAGHHIGCGITNYGAADVEKIKGARSEQITEKLGYDYGPEVIHKNNLALVQTGGANIC